MDTTLLDTIERMPEQRCSTLFLNGRVIDPETGLDGVRNVGIRDGVITFIGTGVPAADEVIDITGRVLSPGFIDMHSHAQSPLGNRMQALDGVTTALDLEAGALPISLVYERAEREGRPLNFGFSSSWALARVAVMDDVRVPRRDGS